MTREEMRKRFAQFRYSGTASKEKTVQDNNKKIDDDWTEKEILATAKRIMKKLGIPEDALSE